MDYQQNIPEISILIPTYNRRKFLPFILRNLKVQQYPHNKLQVVIDDDGTEPLLDGDDYKDFIDAIKPIKLKYIRNKKKCSIGEKRNRLIKNANHNILAMMDDDDLYEPTYLTHSYNVLKSTGVGCVGSDKLIFLYPPYTKEDFYSLDCGDNKKLIHEATMVFHRKWYNKTNGFDGTSRAENAGLINSTKLKTIELTNPYYTMTAICHNKNTINKDKFKREETRLDINSWSTEITDFIKNVVGE